MELEYFVIIRFLLRQLDEILHLFYVIFQCLTRPISQDGVMTIELWDITELLVNSFLYLLHIRQSFVVYCLAE